MQQSDPSPGSFPPFGWASLAMVKHSHPYQRIQMKHPPLTGRTVRLRSVEGKDAELMFDLVSDSDAMKRLGVTEVLPRKAVEGWAAVIADQVGRIDFAVTALDADDYLGEAVLYDIDESAQSAKLRVLLRGAYRGRGLEFEAAQLLLAEATTSLRLHRVGFEVLSIDEGGLEVARRLGLHEEGRLRQTVRIDGEFVDRIVFSLIAGESLGQAND